MREEVVKKVTHIRVICDFCNLAKSSCSIKGCTICGRDVCFNCGIKTEYDYLMENNYLSDYPDYYCKDCWGAGKEEREEILRLREELDVKEDMLFSSWKDKCKKGV